MNKQETPNNPPVEINLIPKVLNAFGEKVLFEDPKPIVNRCNFKYGGIMEIYRPKPSSYNPKI